MAPTSVLRKFRPAVRCISNWRIWRHLSDQIRSEIVATKEGGAITGEERLREYVAKVYGDVNGYNGRPTDAQVARTAVLGRQLEEVIQKFQKLTSAQLPGINAELQKQKMPPISVVSEADWQKQHQRAGAAQSQTANTRMREMD